jgi:tRNA(Phe) wybutosine-synthesizing methylase Tyw3
MKVTILAHLSHDGQEHTAIKGVDACIADLVRALNAGGVVTTSSCCCGHGRTDGSILLADGRELRLAARQEKE